MKGEFLQALPIIETIQENGYEAYFVGGSVRDFLLGRKIGDVDIATSATPDEVQKMFPKTIDVGKKHGTVIVLLNGKSYEVTTFRTEGQYVDYRKPQYVRFIRSLKEDLRRRDFTINAMAMDKTGEIIDYFGGKNDLKNRVIRTVGNPYERFSEDALRMLRALRFVSQLSFQLEEETKNAIIRWNPLLKEISIERITNEMEKLFAGQSSNQAIRLLAETDVYRHLPGISHLQDRLLKISDYPLQQLTEREDYWLFLTYMLKIEDVRMFLQQWKLPRKLIQNVALQRERLSVLLEKGWTNYLLYQAGIDSALQLERVKQVLQKEKNVSAFQTLKDQYINLPIRSRTDLAITGKDILDIIEKKPGQWVSKYLQIIEEHVLNRKLENDSGNIKEWLIHCNQKLDENC